MRPASNALAMPSIPNQREILPFLAESKGKYKAPRQMPMIYPSISCCKELKVRYANKIPLSRNRESNRVAALAKP